MEFGSKLGLLVGLFALKKNEALVMVIGGTQDEIFCVDLSSVFAKHGLDLV